MGKKWGTKIKREDSIKLLRIKMKRTHIIYLNAVVHISTGLTSPIDFDIKQGNNKEVLVKSLRQEIA